jgi:DNA-binding response OmpR family regulator
VPGPSPPSQLGTVGPPRGSPQALPPHTHPRATDAQLPDPTGIGPNNASAETDNEGKPFSPAELVARVDAVLRRIDHSPDTEPAIELAELKIDPGARRVHVRGEEAQLTQREFELLLFLARHPGQAFSRNQLMEAVWHYSFYTDTSTVTVHIRRLRYKIERDPAEPRHLQTVWGVGYRFQP